MRPPDSCRLKMPPAGRRGGVVIWGVEEGQVSCSMAGTDRGRQPAHGLSACNLACNAPLIHLLRIAEYSPLCRSVALARHCGTSPRPPAASAERPRSHRHTVPSLPAVSSSRPLPPSLLLADDSAEEGEEEAETNWTSLICRWQGRGNDGGATPARPRSGRSSGKESAPKLKCRHDECRCRCSNYMRLQHALATHPALVQLLAQQRWRHIFRPQAARLQHLAAKHAHHAVLAAGLQQRRKGGQEPSVLNASVHKHCRCCAWTANRHMPGSAGLGTHHY